MIDAINAAVASEAGLVCWSVEFRSMVLAVCALLACVGSSSGSEGSLCLPGPADSSSAKSHRRAADRRSRQIRPSLPAAETGPGAELSVLTVFRPGG